MRAALYRIGIELYGLGVRLAALRNTKAREWLRGRRSWQSQLKEELQELTPEQSENNLFRPLWIHAASLGEMEQGRPLLKGFKKEFPEAPVVVSFFSPSGFLHFPRTELVDLVTYLPLDRPSDAREFVDLLQPRLALFIKYEIWPFYFRALQRRSIPLVLAPALFRPDQIYFKPFWRGFFLPILKQIDQIMVQNKDSQQLLQKKGFARVMQVGDPRFDRAAQVARETWPEGKAIEEWQQNNFILVAGSSWPPEEKLLAEAMATYPKWKLLLAPHDLSQSHLNSLKEQFALYGIDSWGTFSGNPENRVLLIDKIGLLKSLYRCGDAAIVGGGLGKSLHSTIEPMAYGLPLAFGPAHRKFLEPQELIDRGGATEIHDAQDFLQWLQPLLANSRTLKQGQSIVRDYFQEKCGATNLIVQKMIELWRRSKQNR